MLLTTWPGWEFSCNVFYLPLFQAFSSPSDDFDPWVHALEEPPRLSTHLDCLQFIPSRQSLSSAYHFQEQERKRRYGWRGGEVEKLCSKETSAAPSYLWPFPLAPLQCHLQRRHDGSCNQCPWLAFRLVPDRLAPSSSCPILQPSFQTWSQDDEDIQPGESSSQRRRWSSFKTIPERPLLLFLQYVHLQLFVRGSQGQSLSLSTFNSHIFQNISKVHRITFLLYLQLLRFLLNTSVLLLVLLFNGFNADLLSVGLMAGVLEVFGIVLLSLLYKSSATWIKMMASKNQLQF